MHLTALHRGAYCQFPFRWIYYYFRKGNWQNAPLYTGRQGGHINSTTDSPLLNMKMLVNCRAQCTTLKTSRIIETYCSLNKTLIRKARNHEKTKNGLSFRKNQIHLAFQSVILHDRLYRIFDILPIPTSVR